MPTIAIAQEAPILLDREQTLARVSDLIAEAAGRGARLIVFPEAFISTYPAWIWRLRPGSDWGTNEALHARMIDSAVNVDRGDLAPVQAAAKAHSMAVVAGINELDSERSGATLYNSLVTIGENGEILNRHRKLMPTNPEKMVWGFGDGSGLNVVDTAIGRIGSLVCWENYMPLARYALYAQGVEVYIAPTYDSGEGWLGSMQHIAREGRCWVLNSGVALQGSDIPEDFPDRAQLYPDPDEWINPGDSAVIAPGGEIVAGPMHREKGLLFADIDAEQALKSKRALDVAGHYSRPDVFTLHINKHRQNPIKISS